VGEGAAPARLVIVDDHALVRSGIRSMLAGDPELAVVGEAASGPEAIDLCRRLRPDLVLMDIRMPGMDGFAATRAIKAALPRTGVIMVTMQEDPDALFAAVGAGAAGYVLKGATPDELTAAIRTVLGGESLLDQRLTMALLRSLAAVQQQPAAPVRQPESPVEPLTVRETEVLRLLARGLTNGQIADALVVSPGTVKNHVGHIIAKLGVADRTQAAVRALELGLLATE
jgi:DNA-binding NarL/FixJ family response regulator